MAVDFSNTEIDTNTGLPKKKQQTQQLPYLNENGATGNQNILPVVQPQQQATQQGIQQGNINVMQSAQQQALKPQDTSLQQQTTAMTQKMMNDPNFGMDWQKYNTGAMSNYDAQRAQQAQALRQQVGDIGGSGEVQANLMKTLMAQAGPERSALENELNMQQYNQQKENWQNALTAGLNQQQSTSNLQSQAIQNLLGVRSAYEGERAQNQAQQNTVDLAKLSQAQELERMGVQQGYNLENIKAGQQGAIELQKLGFDQQTQLMAQQQGYDLTKLKTAQDFTAAQQKIQDDLKLAMQKNDEIAVQNLTILQGKIASAAQAQAQKNAIELQNLGYNQDIQKMAINQGYDLQKMDKAFGNDITKLVTASQLDTQSKSTLMQLQDKIDTKQLLTKLDFEGTQNDLERQLKLAMQKNDATNIENLTRLKSQLDMLAQDKQNQFIDSQRVATQAYNTSERLSTQDFEKAAQYYDWAQRNAQQANDIQAQKDIQTMQGNLQLKMQTNDMNHDEAMTYLKYQLDDAMANGNAERQKQILDYTYNQDLGRMNAELGNDLAKINYQGNIQQALQAGEFGHAEAMQTALLQSQAQQAELNRGIQRLEISMQQQGIDLNRQQSAWDNLKEGVASGSINPEALTEFLQGIGAQTGITIEPTDPLAAYQEAQKQMTGLKQQFGMTHPEYVANASTGELTPEGAAAFNSFYNQSMFGEDENAVSNNVAGISSQVANAGLGLLGPTGAGLTYLDQATGGKVTGTVGSAINSAWNWLKGIF